MVFFTRLCASVCGLGRDVPLLSSAGWVINGRHTYQTNMDPTVAMGTAAAAPQKGGREDTGGGEVECEVKNKRGREEQQRDGWWMEEEEIETEGWRERGEERSPLLSVWTIWFSRKGWPWRGRQRQEARLSLSLSFPCSVFLLSTTLLLTFPSSDLQIMLVSSPDVTQNALWHVY